MKFSGAPISLGPTIADPVAFRTLLRDTFFVREEFIEGIESNRAAFGLELTETTVERLADHYEFVREANPLLHLVAPCSAEEFALRHVLESLTLLKFLPPRARLADVGTGAGLPSIPCLIAREDLRGLLIESKEKKALFLTTTIDRLGLRDRAEVAARQFQEVDPAGCSVITCRALDKFTEKLPRLLKWAGERDLLLFGGENLEEALLSRKVRPERVRMPMSERRYLFVIRR